MHTGILLFDNSHKVLEEKIKDATKHHQKKHGRQPTLCLVHPSALENRPGVRSFTIGALTVRLSRAVPPDHIWVGIEDAATDARGER